jgi:hypothetical protein
MLSRFARRFLSVKSWCSLGFGQDHGGPMGSIYEVAALVGLALGGMALWKISQLEKFTKPNLKTKGQRKSEEAERRIPEKPRLPMPVKAMPGALEFFRLYDDAIDHLNKLHQHGKFSFDNERLTTPEPDDRGSVPTRRMKIYYGNSYAGTIELKLWDIGDKRLWADLQLYTARRYPGSEVEWLAETVAWLVVDSDQDLVSVNRATLDRMARWAWQIGEDAPMWGTFGERYEGNGTMWQADWAGN